MPGARSIEAGLDAGRVRIRAAEERDAAALAAFAAATFTDTFGHLYPPEDLRGHLEAGYTGAVFGRLIADPRMRLWVAEEGSEPLGYAQAGPCKLPHPEARHEHGELMRFYVVPAWKGTGLAQRLMREVVAWLEATFEGPLWLGVYSDNLRAQRFYERFGFQKVGEYEYPVGRVRDREFIFRREAG